MQIKLFILFVCCSSVTFAQSKIEGYVIDNETRKPVYGVVVFTNEKGQATMTDEQGRYFLDINLAGPIYFQHLAYDFLSTTSDSLLVNPNVRLVCHTVELSEIVISPLDAQLILDKAFENLVKNYFKKGLKSYLYHIEESTNSGAEKEAYALVEATRILPNFKKRLLFNYHLILLDKTKIRNESDFFVKDKPLKIEIFQRKIGIQAYSDKYIYELYDNSEETFVVKASPKHPDKKNYGYFLYTINKEDTVLLECMAQSYPDSQELTLAKVRGIFWQKLNHFGKINFVKDKISGLYALKEILFLGEAKILNEKAITESFKITGYEVTPAAVFSKVKKKKIKSWDNAIFESNFPNSPDFWKAYILPNP
jgi:hypothetical protein